MKFNKQLAVILVLISMLLSAIAISVYFYNENKKVVNSKNKLVSIFVANKNIKKDSLITNKDIKQTTIARQYVLTKPLLKKEILNKYAKESIYKNEAFLKEKLTNKMKVEEVKTLDYKYNSYNMSFELFQNPNFSLEPNDIIKIISVYPKENIDGLDNYSVQYVAKNIRIIGFLMKGKSSDKTIIKKKIKKLVKKKQIEQIIDVRADEIILDIKQDILLSLIDDYNKGKQLWMVKSKLEKNTTDTQTVAKEKLDKPLIKAKKKIKRKTKRITYAKKRLYPVKWYQPKETVSTKTATISYANDNDIKQTLKAKIKSNYSQECSNSDKLLLGISNNIYLRTHASIRAKVHKKVYKNYILPYKDVSKINTDWFVLCDGSYVEKKNVKIISYEEYKRLKS
jgi:hypothetical protein